MLFTAGRPIVRNGPVLSRELRATGWRYLGLTEDFIERRMTNDSHTKTLIRDASLSAPLAQRFCLAFVGEHSARPAILGLFGPCGPTTVTGLVTPVVVHPFDGMLGARPWAKVSVKGSKGLLPFFANRNTSATIVLVGLRQRIRAALKNVDPRRILARARQAVSQLQRGHAGTSKAPAGLCLAFAQGLGGHAGSRAAVALTVPPRGFNAGATVNDEQSSESLASEVVLRLHR